MLGFLNIYKPSGVTSAQVVAQLKKKFNLSKIGHMGTLDPMASGVLPVAIGKATKLFDFFLQKEKTYIAQFEFGYITDTLDSEGEVLDKSLHIPSKKDIEGILPLLIGDIEQVPPQFSAKNVQGKRAYTLARNGIKVELPPKKVFIKELVLLQQLTTTKFEFSITCSSGTYIRSIARDMGQLLHTYATMNALTRTKCGYFRVEEAKIIENIEKVEDVLLSPIEVFKGYDVVNLREEQMTDLKNGKYICINRQDGAYWLVYHNKVFGLGICKADKMKTSVYLWEEE